MGRVFVRMAESKLQKLIGKHAMKASERKEIRAILNPPLAQEWEKFVNKEFQGDDSKALEFIWRWFRFWVLKRCKHKHEP